MLAKLARIFGITGGILTLLPYLLIALYCLCVILFPSVDQDFRPFAPYFFWAGILPSIIAAAGLTGSFLNHKKPLLSGILMTVSGLLMLLTAFPFAVLRFVFQPVLYILPLPLIAAGTLELISWGKHRRKQVNHEDASTS